MFISVRAASYKHQGSNSYMMKVTGIAASVLLLVMLLAFLYIYKRKRKFKGKRSQGALS